MIDKFEKWYRGKNPDLKVDDFYNELLECWKIAYEEGRQSERVLKELSDLGQKIERERVETGIVQFGDDWPGTFIRGDTAAGYAAAIDFVQVHLPAGVYESILRSLGKLLEKANTRNHRKDEVQHIDY